MCNISCGIQTLKSVNRNQERTLKVRINIPVFGFRMFYLPEKLQIFISYDHDFAVSSVMQRSVDTVLTNKIAVYKLPQENLDYVSLLKKYFALRKKRNPRYSLRKYAKDLEITPMHLSYILRGQRGLSRRKAEIVAKVLRLSYKDRKTFLQIVSALSARASGERNLAQLGLRNSLISSRES